jgi:hypothetical protein
MSVFPPKADIGTQPRDVRFVPMQTLRDAAKDVRATNRRWNRPAHIGVIWALPYLLDLIEEK